MGRNRESGLNYYPFDIDFFADIKIRKLIKYQGGKAVTVYALLLCLIYKSGYYMRWDDELPFICSEQTGFDEAYISEVIKSCLALGLFDSTLFNSDSILTSRGIQERYANILKLCKRKATITDYNLIHSEQNGISSELIPDSSEQKAINPEFMPQSKIKRNKENKISAIADSRTYEIFLNEFFKKTPTEILARTCSGIGISIDQFRAMATEIINDWATACRPYKDYSDTASHLISTIRIKVSKMTPASKTSAIEKGQERYRQERQAEQIARESHAATCTTWEAFARSRGIDPNLMTAKQYAQSKTEHK